MSDKQAKDLLLNEIQGAAIKSVELPTPIPSSNSATTRASITPVAPSTPLYHHPAPTPISQQAQMTHAGLNELPILPDNNGSHMGNNLHLMHHQNQSQHYNTQYNNHYIHGNQNISHHSEDFNDHNHNDQYYGHCTATYSNMDMSVHQHDGSNSCSSSSSEDQQNIFHQQLPSHHHPHQNHQASTVYDDSNYDEFFSNNVNTNNSYNSHHHSTTTSASIFTNDYKSSAPSYTYTSVIVDNTSNHNYLTNEFVH